MRCSKAQRKIIAFLYGTLSPKEKLSLAKHLKTCPRCQEELRFSEEMFQVLNQEREPAPPPIDWEKSWARIETKLKTRPQPQKSSFLRLRWVYGVSLLGIVFLVGLGLGYYLSHKAPTSISSSGLNYHGEGLHLALKSHLERIKPILIELQNANHSGEEAPPLTITVDQNLLRALLLENYLLRQAIKDTSPQTSALLDDLDLILKDLANQKDISFEEAKLWQAFLQERSLLLRTEILSET